MEVSKEEILHIAQLANLKLQEEEIPDYLKNLQDILNFAKVVNEAPVDGLNTSVGSLDNFNVFRKDEVKVFEDVDSLLDNAPTQDQHMFKLPKVIN